MSATGTTITTTTITMGQAEPEDAIDPGARS
jgi:hypothetical protein